MRSITPCAIITSVHLTQKIPVVKKYAHPKNAVVKKAKWQPRNGCDLMENYSVKPQVNLCCLLHISLEFSTKFTIVIIKIFTISL